MGSRGEKDPAATAWQRFSDLGRIGLIGGAIGLPLVRGQVATSLRAGLAIALASGASKLLKKAFSEERPDHSDRQSFPSDHSAETFAAAAVLHRRESPLAGFSAIACAALVGAGRVAAGKHHVHDVAAGALIGAAAARA